MAGEGMLVVARGRQACSFLTSMSYVEGMSSRLAAGRGEGRKELRVSVNSNPTLPAGAWCVSSCLTHLRLLPSFQ